MWHVYWIQAELISDYTSIIIMYTWYSVIEWSYTLLYCAHSKGNYENVTTCHILFKHFCFSPQLAKESSFWSWLFIIPYTSHLRHTENFVRCWVRVWFRVESLGNKKSPKGTLKKWLETYKDKCVWVDIWLVDSLLGSITKQQTARVTETAEINSSSPRSRCGLSYFLLGPHPLSLGWASCPQILLCVSKCPLLSTWVRWE